LCWVVSSTIIREKLALKTPLFDFKLLIVGHGGVVAEASR
jgi:hypothetical protein